MAAHREYTLSADFDDRWRTGGLEDDVIAEAHLDVDSVFEGERQSAWRLLIFSPSRLGIKRFADDRDDRLRRQREAFGLL